MKFDEKKDIYKELSKLRARILKLENSFEPPQKSAFQEWFSGPSKSPSKVIVKAIVDSFSAKEGWNAAIDAVLRLNIFSKMGENSWWLDKEVERLKELKEP